MTCKDCIHYYMCKIIDNKMERRNMSFNEAIKEKCEDFKEKSCVLDLPCKVGDTVWCIAKRNFERRIFKDTINSIKVFYLNNSEIIQIKTFEFGFSYLENAFGKTIFFTEKEAKQALKEFYR